MDGIGSGSGAQSNASRLTGRLRIPAQIIATIRNVLGSPQEWIGIVLLFFTLAVAVWSIEHANWVKREPSLILVLGLSVLAGLWLARGRWPGKVVYPLAIVLGIGVTVWQSVGLVPTSETESALGNWWQTLTSDRPNEDPIFLAMFLILVTWVAGFISTWFLVRRRNAWVAVTAGTVTILINLSNLRQEDYYFLPIFLFVALLLLGQASLAKQGVWFQQHNIRFSRPSVIKVVGAVVVISVITVTTAWVVPKPPVEQMGLDLVALLRDNAQNQWYNIFAVARTKWVKIDSDNQMQLSFSSSVSTSTRTLFIVTADQPSYWRVRRYDDYQSWGWTSSEVVEYDISQLVAIEDTDPTESELVTYTVENRLRTDVLLVSGEVVSINIPALGQVFVTVENEEVPLDSSDGVSTEVETDIVAVVSPKLMGPYQRYAASTSITALTPEELSQAGEDYPEAIIDHYLQLPDTLPLEVRLLSQEVTAEAETAYDKVIAVKEYLQDFEYNREAEKPPEGADGVAYFLFESKEGVCTSFSSALAVMLRSVGVPSRLNTGYLEGVYDRDTGSYTLRAKDYHARTEVYFPEYGWVEFSATPGDDDTSAVIDTSDDGTSEPLYPPEILPEDTSSPVEGDYKSSGTAGRSGLPGPALYVYFAVFGIPLVLYLAVRLGYAYWLVRLKRVDNPADVYNRMCYLASLSKFGPRPEETPLEYSGRLARVIPSQAQAVNTIAQTYIETQFGRSKELTGLQKGRMQKSWVELCPFLLKRLLSLRRRSE
ncbi:MAG TPA: transglutaminase domain-containing protein [Dehalococcoidia bacterium]|nr:transglutaminase domain-containing protein [Dehalococcoidia bacterium]